MEARHVRWAQQHDWYHLCSYNTASGKWTVTVRDSLATNPAHAAQLDTCYPTFTSIEALKHWAGY